MANHALVIGCDSYWNDAAALEGAVRDALAVRTWLLRPDRGAVPRQNLTLLLSPTGRSPVPPALAGVPEATRRNIVQALDGLLMRADGDEGTLYFFFAGHGLTAEGDGYDEPCLLPSDFEPNYPDPALPVRAVREQLATASLATQLIIIDACRGVPANRKLRASGLAHRRERDYTSREPDQFVRLATSAGDVAYETGPAGMAGGEFTRALLRGLHGAGSAKRWDLESEQYVVRVRELFDFVRADLVRAGVAQAPRAMDSYNEPNPVLVRFPDDAVDPATLTITVTPADAAAGTTFQALGPVDHDDRIARPPLANPLALRLQPRTYSLRAHAPGWVTTTRRAGLTVDLYDDTAVEIALEPSAAADPRDIFAGRPEHGFTPASLDEGSTVVGPDPSALLEAVDETGRVYLGAGKLALDRVGRYRLRVVEPHATGTDLVVEVLDHQRTEYHPEPPSPAPALRAMLDALPHLAGKGLTIITSAGWTRVSPAAMLSARPGPNVIAFTDLLDRPLHVATFAPGALVADGALVLHYPLDPDLLPRADRAQRFAAAGRIAEALAVLASGEAGIVGTALRGLLAARNGATAADDVAKAAATLGRSAPDLPDTAVLTALARTYDSTRPVPPELSAVPMLAAGLRAALRLYRGARVEPPDFLADAAANVRPDQVLTTWFSA